MNQGLQEPLQNFYHQENLHEDCQDTKGLITQDSIIIIIIIILARLITSMSLGIL